MAHLLQMEKEIRELTKQRDLAQYRVEDLLCLVGDGDTRKPVCTADFAKLLKFDKMNIFPFIL